MSSGHIDSRGMAMFIRMDVKDLSTSLARFS